MEVIVDVSSWLTILNILIAFLGVFLVAFAFFEWRRLSAVLSSVKQLEERVQRRVYANLKATHRVLAAYTVTDPRKRIPLLESALEADPDAFNGWNSLGYAFLEINEIDKAIDAFSQAVFRHPDDKAGYCDLAYAHLVRENRDLALRYLRKAISVDPSARDDIQNDSRLAELILDL